MSAISEKNKRNPLTTIIIGAQQTGKTKFICDFLKSYQKPALVVVPDAFELKYNDYKIVSVDQIGKYHRSQIVFDREDKFFLKKIRSKFLNGALVFDDTKFCLRPWNYMDFEDIIGRNRQTNTDVFCMYHSFDRIPDFFWTYSKRMVLFKTLILDSNKTNSIRQQYVNQLAKQNPYARVVFNIEN